MNLKTTKTEQKEEWKKEDYKTLRNDVLQLLGENPKKVSEKIVKEILMHEYIYTTRDDARNEMWIYKEGIYIPQGKSFIREICREILGSFYNTLTAYEVTSKIEVDTAIKKEDFFINNYIYEIPVINGILNIKTKKLIPFNPTKIFFSKIPIKYNPNAKCPAINKFLSEIMADKTDKNVFYEIAGFCLHKEYTFEKAFMFLGTGRNGKSKCLELIKRAIGAENCFSLPLNALKSDNADLSQLFGKMVNLAGDIGYEDLKDTATFKSLTGRDLITARRKFLTAITFENYAKFIFSCNQLPKVYDLSKAFWDRWILIEFPYYFATKEELAIADITTKDKWKERDENIISKITQPDEFSGFLNEILTGYDRLMQNKKFSTTKGTEEVKSTWMRLADSFYAFCEENIASSNDEVKDRVPKRELRKKYKEYCTKHNLKMSNDKYIQEFLEKNYFVSTKQDSSYEYLWTGLKMKDYIYQKSNS